MQQSDI